MPSVHEQISEQFGSFERRGRGWDLFTEPVTPEPPFQHFFGYSITPALDDGRRPTFLSSFANGLSRFLAKTPPALSGNSSQPKTKLNAYPLIRQEKLSELKMALPANFTGSREAFETFLLNLDSFREPIAFELIGTVEKIVAQFASHPQDMPSLRRQLTAYFPETGFVPAERTVEAFGEGNDYSAIVEFGLGREFLHPLGSGKIDSLIGLTGALSELREGEAALCQVIFEPCRNPWAETVRRLVSDHSGKPLFVNRPEFIHLAEAKVSKRLYAVVLRVAAESDTIENVWDILRNLARALRVFAHPNGNEFIPLRNDDYPFDDHIEDLRRRQTRRSGMLLNVDELIGLVHLPSAAVKAGKFIRQATNTKAAPRLVTHSNGVVLGTNLHRLPPRK